MPRITDTKLFQLAHKAAQQRGSPQGEQLARIFYQAYQLSQNYNYDFHSNGEARLLKVLSTFRMNTVFDVGGNKGDWTKLVLKIYPEANIYSFEPIPEMFTQLTASTQHEPRVRRFNTAVGADESEVTLRYYPGSSGQSSLFEFPVAEPPVLVSCKSIALDSFVVRESIEEIDFLKIDVEGAEHLVLAGAKSLLQSNKIRVLQFEYGLININTHFLLKDFYDLFAQAGYCIGKVYPNWVDFAPYSHSQENFIGPNFVAVRKEEVSILEVLSKADS